MEAPVWDDFDVVSDAPGRHGLFVLSFALYGGVMLAGLFATTPQGLYLPAAIWIFTLAVVVLFFLAMVRQGSDHVRSNGEEHSWTVEALVRATPVIVVGFYVSCHLLYLARLPNELSPGAILGHPFGTVAVFQGALLGVLLGVFNQRLRFSTDGMDLPEDKVEFLRFRMGNWWRFAQVTMTTLFAFGAGVAATTYLNRGAPGLGVHALTSLVGVIALAAFTLAKFEAVERQYRKALNEE